MRQKGFAPILIIILILVVVGGVYYFGTKRGSILLIPTQTPNVLSSPTTTLNSTTNWKTFKSNLYGFTIEYPLTITPPEESAINNSLNPPASGYMQFNLPEVQNWIDSLSIKVWSNPAKLSTSDWIAQQRLEAKKSGAPNISPESEKNIEINGISGYQSVNFAGDGNMKDTYIAKDTYIIEVSFYDTNPNIPNQEQNKTIFETMLSTFKFTQ